MIIISSSLQSQTICDGNSAMTSETFNICNDDPWVLVFEDDFLISCVYFTQITRIAA